MKINEEDIISQNSTAKTSTSSYNDDTYFQEVNNPFFPKIRPRVPGNSFSNTSLPSSNTVYIPSSKINEENKKKSHKFFFFKKSKDKGKNIINDDDKIRIENDNNNDKISSKFLASPDFFKIWTISYVTKLIKN